MTKVKVLDLARDVGMEDDKLLLKLKRMGVKVKDKKSEEPEKMKSLSDERVIERDSEKEVIEKRIKPTVIRRRTHHLEQKVETPPQVEIPPPVEMEISPKTLLEVTEKKAVEKEAKPRVKGTRKKKTEEQREGILQVETTGEVKETIPAKPEEKKAVSLPTPSQEVERKMEAKKEGQLPKIQEPKIQVSKVPETKFKESPEEKPEIIPSVRKKLLDKEELEALTGKKKGFIKKRRMVEERVLVEGEPLEEEVRTEKEGEPRIRTFRPVKKKVVVKESKKTLVTVPKPIKRIIRIAEMITVGDLAKRMGVKGGELIKKLMAMGLLPGTPVKLIQSFPSYVFRLGYTQFAVDRKIADEIYVKLLSAR